MQATRRWCRLEISNSWARLVETKGNVKDAARKFKHVPDGYGRVLFVTKDQHRLRIVNVDGSLGETVEMDDLFAVRDWMRASKPT